METPSFFLALHSLYNDRIPKSKDISRLFWYNFVQNVHASSSASSMQWMASVMLSWASARASHRS